MVTVSVLIKDKAKVRRGIGFGLRFVLGFRLG